MLNKLNAKNDNGRLSPLHLINRRRNKNEIHVVKKYKSAY